MSSDSGLGYRLSFNEIVYLAARTNAKEIYGLKHEPKNPDEETVQKEWEEVKAGLTEKGFFKEKDNDLTLDGSLFELIEIMSEPELFFVCQTRDDFTNRSTNYYIKNQRAVKLEYEDTNKELYTLVKFSDAESLKRSIQGFLEVKTKEFPIIEEKIVFGIDELSSFINSIINNDDQEQQEILKQKGVSENNLLDISEALVKKNCLRTMLVISFKNDNVGVVKEYIIYGGEKYLWQIELRDNKATIISIDNETIMKKIDVLAETLYYV